MDQTEIPENIKNELVQAQAALVDGNDGKARVCARRAVGKAFQLSKHSRDFESQSPRIASAISANECLKIIAAASESPAEVRDAARRLSANVTDKDISQKPIEDALVVIAELLGRGQ